MIQYSLILANNKYDIDKSFIDPWSGIHTTSGLLLGIFNLSNINIICLAILWEIIENSPLGKILWDILGWHDYNGDTLLNIISDIIFVISFSQISKKMKTTKSLYIILLCLIYYKCYNLYLH